jgi:hypothetical protein
MVDRCVSWLNPGVAELTDSAVTLEELGKGDRRITFDPKFLCPMPLAKANLRLSISTPH